MAVVASSSHAALDSLDGATALNLASACQATRALGPGLRAALWVQGCAFHCPGCIAPDWIPIQPVHRVPVDRLAYALLANPRVSGLTISGGEPMLQAAGLARLVHRMKEQRDLDVICFTGFTYEQLRQAPPGPGVGDLLAAVDVLIDGPYVQRLNDNAGLRGSRNQRVLQLSGRLARYDFENGPRRAEVHINQGRAMLVGVPPDGMAAAFHQSLDAASQIQGLRGTHERI